MNGIHIETLKRPEPEGDSSSVATIISELFSNELSEHKWRSQTKDSLLTLISEKVESRKIKEHDPHYLLLLRSLKKPKTIEECLFAMTNFLLGKGL